ncbi:Hly-III related protein [Wilcoxina mikolae CBS 423.85]|nr:Hly-III related protein [Wilcoxina mikolae CBS 423.85]
MFTEDCSHLTTNTSSPATVRNPTPSLRASTRSYLYLHNGTFNIYSRLLPAILSTLAVLACSWYFTTTHYADAIPGDKIVFSFFFATAAICFGLSASYHTLMNHSENMSHLWLRMDFVGIVILTLGDFVSGIYMVFYCEPMQQKIYWTMILTLGTATDVMVVSPQFQGRRWRTVRVCSFVGTGLSGFAPLAHGIRLFGWTQMWRMSGMPYYLLEGALLILGALFYAARIPERFVPGRFDILGCSHQIFHVLVVAATAVHAVGILDAYEYNRANRSCGIGGV